MNEQPACLLCGNPNRYEIRTALVAWKEPHDEPFASIPRCTDVQACRERCEAIDEPWLVREPGKGAA